MNFLRHFLVPNRWRSVATVLILLGFVLPMSKCTYPIDMQHPEKGHETAYLYVLTEPIESAVCQPPADNVLCYMREGLAFSLMALLWPLIALLVAIRAKSRRAKIIRLSLEPFLIGGTGFWLFGITFLNTPASGYYTTATGLWLLAGAWLIECTVAGINMFRRRRGADELRL